MPGLIARILLLGCLCCSPWLGAQTALTTSGKTLAYCVQQAPETLNPQLTVHNSTFDASARLLYDRLLAYKPGTTELAPGLAQSWEITDNGRVYTLYLRADVPFHSNAEFTPQRPFNADDVLFTFARQWRKNHPYYNVSGGTYDYFEGMGISRTVLAIDRLDEQTVQFTLKQADASFLATLALPFASIQSAEYAEQLLREGKPEQLDRRPIGTGPFQFSGYRSEQELVYQANERYWNGRPLLDHIVLAISPDPAQAYAKLRNGQCHVLPPVPIGQTHEWQNRRGIRVLQKPALDLAYLAFNTQRPPFDDSRVRRALSLAVDRQAIVQVGYQNGAQQAEHILPPAIWNALQANLTTAKNALADQLAARGGKDADKEAGKDDGNAVLVREIEQVDADLQAAALSYDPAQARQLLQEAGYADGFKTTLWVLPVQRDYLPDPLQTAKLIRADWALLGVEAELLELPWEAFLARSRKGEHQTILLGWVGDNGDPDNFLTPLLSCANVNGSNRARWCDSEFENLLRQARLVTEPAKRSLLYSKALLQVERESPWLMLAHSLRFQALRRGVKDFVMDPFGGSYFNTVDLQ